VPRIVLVARQPHFGWLDLVIPTGNRFEGGAETDGQIRAVISRFSVHAQRREA
jgi:hypothetical protein